MTAASSPSWLIKGGSDRERLRDMDRRLRPVRTQTMLVLAGALLLSGPWVGWWTLLPLLISAGLFRLADVSISGSMRPEYWMFAAWSGSVAIIAVSVALTGDSAVALLAMLAIPVVTLSARFSARGILIGVAITLGLMIGVAFGTDAAGILESPPDLIAPLAVVISIAILSTALMHSDVEHRGKAVIDQLTGLLNRGALESRANELEQQSEITGEPVALIVADLDGFKLVNDSHGHAYGDDVLRRVASLVRSHLRAFDLAYRLGGDEFLILLPGADLDAGEMVARGLRTTIGAAAPDGTGVTISCGVSSSLRGGAFDFDEVFRDADTELYEAKRGGGDRVRSASPAPRVAV